MAFNCFYRAWNTASNTFETGDAANHTVNVEVDGTPVTGLTETEVANGLYRVNLSDAQLPKGSRFAAYGSSSTADVEIFGESGVRPETMRGTDSALLATNAPTNFGDMAIEETTGKTQTRLNAADVDDTSQFKADVSNLDATVSSRSSHSAASVWAVGTRALTDKAGFSLSSAGIQAIWDAATSALVTAGSIGKLLIDMLNAAVGSRLASSSYTAPDNTNIGNIWGRVNELTEDDGSGNQRYTTKALEQAPSGGGGGDATEANQTTIIAHLVGIKGSTFVEGTDALDALSTAIGNISVGDGQDWVSISVDDGTDPIQGALVGVSPSSDGSPAFWAFTNSSGIAKFRLVAGNTYYKFVQADGFETVRWVSFTAVAD